MSIILTGAVLLASNVTTAVIVGQRWRNRVVDICDKIDAAEDAEDAKIATLNQAHDDATAKLQEQHADELSTFRSKALRLNILESELSDRSAKLESTRNELAALQATFAEAKAAYAKDIASLQKQLAWEATRDRSAAAPSKPVPLSTEDKAKMDAVVAALVDTTKLAPKKARKPKASK